MSQGTTVAPVAPVQPPPAAGPQAAPKAHRLGLTLENGVRVTHGASANVMSPLRGFDVTMHELYAGQDGLSFSGQFGFIEFHTDCRLPRHVHMADDPQTGARRMLPERILVLGGVAMTELCGEYYIIAPGSLVDIPPGVPHTWNACPPGLVLPDGTVSDGTFTMVYNYSENTRFFPTASATPLTDAADYQPWEGDLQQIRFPKMTADDARSQARLIWADALLGTLPLQDA